MCRHIAVVTFLEDEESLYGVDPEFRGLVGYFHQIPFCASFGVSCAGHFEEKLKEFYAKPWGHLNILVDSQEPHIKELLNLIAQFVQDERDASFKKIQHIFGPPMESSYGVWEIRLGDDGCMNGLGRDYYCESLKRTEFPEVYEAAKKRLSEIHSFWTRLEMEVAKYCHKYNFLTFNLERRFRELMNYNNRAA